jgi:hypothetical protein
MKLSILALISLWIAVAAACAAATPSSNPDQVQPGPTRPVPTPLPTLEGHFVFKDILYEGNAAREIWDKLIEHNITDLPSVINVYLHEDSYYVYIHVTDKDDLSQLMAFFVHAGVSGSENIVIIEGERKR